MFVRASLYKCREENQQDVTECFIALIICSTCFGHLYAHHQVLETILVLLPRMVCLCWTRRVEQFPSSRTHSLLPVYWPPTTATKTLHTICGNNPSIFVSLINQLDAQHFCFTISLFHASPCFEHMCSSSGGCVGSQRHGGGDWKIGL